MTRVFFPGLDGHSRKAQFYSDYMAETNRELEARIQTRALKFGVSNGMVVTDATTAIATGVNISSGLAYNPAWKRTLLSGLTFLPLVAADIGKYVIATRNEVSGFPEANPFTGVTAFTRIDDATTLSAVVTPSEALGQIKLALIQNIQPFPTGVTLRTIKIRDRDPLLLPTPVPFVTIGPAGDTEADFAGNDSQPFIDALEQLTTTSGGTIYVKRGLYTPDNVMASGFDTVRLLGSGKGTAIRGTTANPAIRFWDNAVVEIQGISSYHNLSSGTFEMRRDSIVRYRENYASGRILNSWVLELTSGITNVYIEDNFYYKKDVRPFRVNGLSPRSTIVNLVFDSNLVSGALVEMSEQIGNLSIQNNFFWDTHVDSNFPAIGRASPNFGAPQKLLFENNISIGALNVRPLRTHVSGTIIRGNSFYSPVGTIQAVALTTEVTGAGHYSLIEANTFFTRANIDTIDIESALSGIVLRGNVIVADGIGGSQGGIDANGPQGLFDRNITAGFSPASAGLQNTGAGSWGGVTNKTSNKVITS